ncbi:MAG: hypothetical protein QXM00_08800 [Candidatus Bathyarchaeia archaeon]
MEFRYAVAGYLGLSEILKRLDVLAEEQVRLREDMIAGFRRHNEILEKHAQEIAKLREDMITGFKRHDEEMARLREDFNKIYKQLDARLSGVERTLEKITVDIEDEARIILKYRLRDMGYEVEVDSLILHDPEINLYGVSNDLCIIGEASVRASSSIIDEINRKIERLREMHPDRLRPKLIRVVYASIALPDPVERAKKENIWILKATGDIIKPSSLPLS